MSESKALLRRFENPGNDYRGKPFWAWNGLLDADEIRRQLRVMKRMGLGGAFLHSRIGLITPYLSDEWFRMINEGVDECRKLGIEAWLYDEDRWPSGAAGGLVTKDTRYAQKALSCTVIPPGKTYKINGTLLRCFTAHVRGPDASDIEPVKVPKSGRWNGKKHLIIITYSQTPASPWYNGYSYLDTMDYKSVQKFIEVTYDGYQKSCGSEFGKTVLGMFTDEPNRYHINVFPGKDPVSYPAPWTPDLPKVFKKRYGYDILDHLPHIFFDVDGQRVNPARYHYHDCTTFLFVDAFSRQLGEWCGRNGIAFTGHILHEETPSSQTKVVGDSMRFYEHMQIPGIDILTATWYEYDTAKQCASMARQMGRKWVLSELYAGTGWDFPFEGHKAIGDWQAALGINLRCHHLSWFTMAGEAKRDFPASILHQSPWWPEYRKVEDYFARVGVVMTTGKAVSKILVVHPLESTWVRCRAGWLDDAEVKQLDKNLADIRDWLLEGQLDFDYGDEEIMSRYGTVTRSSGKPAMKVGKAAYTTVVVPPMITIRRSTVELLKRFAEAGGRLIFAGPAAKFVDAVCDDALEAVARKSKRVRFSRGAVVKAVEQAGRTIRVSDPGGGAAPTVFYQLRRDRNGRYLFICNKDRKRDYPALEIEIDAIGAEEWDTETGRRFAAKISRRGNRLVVHTSLPPSGSRVFVFPDKADKSLRPRPIYRRVRQVRLPEVWKIQLTEPNVLVLDWPRWRVGGGQWRGAAEILCIDGQLRREMGISRRGGGWAVMMQPWAQPAEANPKTAALELSHTFDVKHLPSGPLDLVFENPEHFRIFLNGVEVDKEDDAGWWVDKSQRRLPLPAGALKVGTNCLTVLCPRFHNLVNLEAAFILGNFGVKVNGLRTTIVNPPAELRTGNWVRQSLPFYSAAVVYHAKVKAHMSRGERAILSLPDWKGTCVIVRAGGQPLGTLGWPPYEIDITDAFAEAGSGGVDLGIEVVSSRRNAFGPLHRAPDSSDEMVGSSRFRVQGKPWPKDYDLVPCGLIKKPILRIVS